MTPEANIALQGAETALWKPRSLSQELNQSPLLISQDPLVVHEMFAHSSGKWFLQFWWVRALLCVSFFPPTAVACAGSCTGEVGKKQDHLSCWQTTAQIWGYSSCFTSCWAWITIVCNTEYWSKMASVSGIFSISGCNSWQFSCCCMDDRAIPAKSVGSLSNCLKISWTPEGSILPYSKKPRWYIFLHKFKFQPQKVTGGKKSEIYIGKQRKIRNNHDQSYQVCTCPRWQKPKPICVKGKCAWITDIFSWILRLWKE